MKYRTQTNGGLAQGVNCWLLKLGDLSLESPALAWDACRGGASPYFQPWKMETGQPWSSWASQSTQWVPGQWDPVSKKMDSGWEALGCPLDSTLNHTLAYARAHIRTCTCAHKQMNTYTERNKLWMIGYFTCLSALGKTRCRHTCCLQAFGFSLVHTISPLGIQLPCRFRDSLVSIIIRVHPW